MDQVTHSFIHSFIQYICFTGATSTHSMEGSDQHSSHTPDERQDEQRTRTRLPELLLPVTWLPVVHTSGQEGKQLTQHQHICHHGLTTGGGRTVHEVGAILRERVCSNALVSV